MVKANVDPRKYAQDLFERNKRVLKELGYEPTAQLDTLTYLLLCSLSELLVLVLSTGNTRFLSQVLTEYADLLAEKTPQKVVKVESAVPLDLVEKKELEESLKEIVGEEFRLDLRLNPKLTGGLVIKVGDKVIDQSLRQHLEKFRKSLEPK